MKKINYVIYSLLLMIGIAGMFAPYLNIDGTYQSVIQILQNYEVNAVFAAVFAAFSTYFIGIILFYFPREKKWVAPISNILFT